MPIFVLEESNYAGPIPDDEILAAKVTGVKQVVKPFKDDDGNEVVKIEFAFVIEDPGGKFDGQRLWGDTSTVFSDNPNCRLFAWTQELFGQELPKGFRLDTDDLVGKHCRVVVAQRAYVKDGEDKIRNLVKDVFRARDGSAFGGVEEEPF